MGCAWPSDTPQETTPGQRSHFRPSMWLEAPSRVQGSGSRVQGRHCLGARNSVTTPLDLTPQTWAKGPSLRAHETTAQTPS